MTDLVLYPNAIWTPFEAWPTSAFRDGENRKGVAHTTQGGPSSLDWSKPSGGVLNWYADPRSKGGIPHFTILGTGAVHQHYRLDHFSRALRNRRGGVETNTDGAIQIELEGYAGHEHTAELLAAMARLVRWLTVTGWVEPSFPMGRMTKPYVVGTNAEWDHGRGWWGHGQIPEQDHTDPDMTDRTWGVFVAAVLGDDDFDPEQIKTPEPMTLRQVRELQSDLWAASLERPELIDKVKYPTRELWVDGIYGNDTKQAEALLAATVSPAPGPEPTPPSIDLGGAMGKLKRASELIDSARAELAEFES